MNESHMIPAASIEGIDLKRIAEKSPTAADEIMRIGELLDRGKETTNDLERLCELLHMYGESAKSEELLRCNIIEEGDMLHRVYRRLHGSASEKQFEHCILAFAQQFNVRLTAKKKLGYLKQEYTSFPLKMIACVDLTIARFLSTPCNIEFQYKSNGCTADIYSIAEEFPEEEYLILKFKNGIWIAKGEKDKGTPQKDKGTP